MTMTEADIRRSKIIKLIQRIEGLAVEYKALSNEKPIDVSSELNKIRRVVIQSGFREATTLSNQLQNELQQRTKRYNEVVQTITNTIATDLSEFESNL
jgi:hypothetical protein